MKRNPKNIQISLFFFLFSIGCIVTFITLDFFFFSYNIKEKLLKNAITISQQKEDQFLDSVYTTENILLSINKSDAFKKYIQQPSIHKENLQDILLMFATHDNNIMQLRYIDKNGFEKIRIDRTNLEKNPFIVKKEYLQNKASRYYFKDSKDKEGVWYSNLDLNMEHGKVETPYKPTLRTMLPIKVKNEFNGILIINYHMSKILNNLQKLQTHNLILFNEEGYPLVHNNKNHNWGYYQTPKYQIDPDSQVFVNQINHAQNIILNDNYVLNKIDIDLPSNLYFTLMINDSYIQKMLHDRYMHYMLVSFIIVVLSIIMSTLFSQYLQKIFVVLKDVKTLNRLLNKKVKEKTKELNDSKQQLNDIITTINDFIWETDTQGRYTYISPQIEYILGYTPKEILGKTPFDLMPPEEAIKVKEAFEHSLKNNKPLLNLKNKNFHKKGHFVYLSTSGNPLFDENNNLKGYRGSDRDITQNVHAQKLIDENYRKIKQLNQDLAIKIKEEVESNKKKDMQLFAQSKMAAMGDMIANIAHQWRQPLSTISTVASGVKLKQEYGQLEEGTLSNDMDIVVERTQHLSKTIETFMNFLKEKKQFQYVSIKKTIHNAIEIVQSSLQSHFILIHTNFDEFEDFEINTICSELQEVLINILQNAKDALIENNVSHREIQLSVLKEKETILIKIEDNAGGVSEDIIDRIFEPYFTTKHESQGTGLGLHMSYRVVTESLEGKIYVNNGQDGAIFCIELPFESPTSV